MLLAEINDIIYVKELTRKIEEEEMKLLEPIKVGNIVLKNRIMFPPMTTGYEERDGSIGKQSFQFYKRLAQGGVSYIVLGDVAPVNTVSPTPKLFHDGQIEAYKKISRCIT